MNRVPQTVALVVGTVVALLFGVGQPVGRPARADAGLKASFARLPLSFVVNRGQLDRRVAFVVQGRDASALFTRGGVSYVLGGRYAVKVDFVGARAVEPVGQRRFAGIVSMFKGDRSEWRAGIPTFGGIVYRDLWPGIDLVWSGERGRLKYTLVARPGADPSVIKLRYRGAKLSVEGGGLVVRTPVRTLREGRPAGSSPLAYTLRGDTVGFRASGYDRSRTLVIDPPALLYAGFLGGSNSDLGNGIAVDAAGNAYLTGYTDSTAVSFPDTPGALDQTDNAGGDFDAFVVKVNAAGDALVYAGFLGGSNGDYGYGIAVDSAGSAYVTGFTDSTAASFPDTPGALDQSDSAGGSDVFVAKVNAAGDALLYAGFLGGSSYDLGLGIAVDSAGNAYISGITGSDAASFPDTPGALDQSDNAGGQDAFVAKVNAAGDALVYAGFLGGSDYDAGRGIAVDSAGNAYISGSTGSTAASFPDTPGALDQSDNAGNYDAFVAKVNAAGDALVYAGFLGGSSDEFGFGIAVDSPGNAYLTGWTRSTAASFPDTTGALDQSDNAGSIDAFVAKVAAYPPLDAPPTVTIDQGAGQADPTTTSPIVFEVVFSEPVADFATGDVSLGGTAGATTATVTGSGTSYTVSVTGMSQSGTVSASLAAGVAHDSANQPNDASTSTDNTVTYTLSSDPLADLAAAIKNASPPLSAKLATDLLRRIHRSRRRSTRARPARRAPSSTSSRNGSRRL